MWHSQRRAGSHERVCSPRATYYYVHCYGHVFNLALQGPMSEVEPLRNALGTIQSRYNFLEASRKTRSVVDFILNYAEFNCTTLSGREAGHWKTIVKLLPTNCSKKVYDSYYSAAEYPLGSPRPFAGPYRKNYLINKINDLLDQYPLSPYKDIHVLPSGD